MPESQKVDYLIIGAGIIGLALARSLRYQFPKARIVLLEKETELAQHGSGRNSGVLHAGFYYSTHSLKAKFTAEGCRRLKAYCQEKNIPINPCQKLVVAQTAEELPTLFELEKRGRANGVELSLLSAKEMASLEPNAKTVDYALHSPQTATVDPVQVCRQLQQDLLIAGVEFAFACPYEKKIGDTAIQAGGRRFEFDKLINAAGLYADKIARDFGFSQKYSILPFKGIYLKYTGPDRPLRTNIYPVPNLKFPFLGVHFTITVDGAIKIGPTAIPAFWRENYSGFSRFSAGESWDILRKEAELFVKNKFHFRDLALAEFKKYQKKHFIQLASQLVQKIDPKGFTEWSRPGIRAQLLNLETLELVQDFVVEGDEKTTHVLNAVSPAFTGSLPFADWVVKEHVEKHDSKRHAPQIQTQL